jgi:gamma-glutamylcysteine synthetase
MDAGQLHPYVAGLFAGGGRRSTRMAVEHELLVADTAGRSVAPRVVRRLTGKAGYGGYLGFEPGGQVELSLPCGPSPAAVARRLRSEVAALSADLARGGLRVLAVPVDPRPDGQVPLRLHSDRYVAMQRHFDAIGPAGRKMMRRTASTQVCLDWWPGAVGLEQWRLLLLAGPFLAAALARSSGPAGRLATWLAVDAGRTAFDDRLLAGPDPVAAYVAFAAGATAFTTPGDAVQHLSTLFPPVRPRGRYLEVRFLDVQPVHHVEHLLNVLGSLLYDDDVRQIWLRRLAGEAGRLATWWQAAATADEEVVGRGQELVGIRDLVGVRGRGVTA